MAPIAPAKPLLVNWHRAAQRHARRNGNPTQESSNFLYRNSSEKIQVDVSSYRCDRCVGSRLLEAILQGQADSPTLAELARGRMRSMLPELERALTRRVRDHHRFLIANHLVQIDFLDEQIAAFDAEIAKRIESPDEPQGQPDQTAQTQRPSASDTPLSWAAAVALLDTIPGVGRRAAEQILAEIGVDMRSFPTEAHIASWTRLSPGNNESAGKRYSGATGHGNRFLRACLVQAAHAAVRVKDSYFKSFYHRLAVRRDVKRAIVAVAYRILTAAYHMLIRREPFRKLGATYLDERNRARVVKGATRRLEQLGY